MSNNSKKFLKTKYVNYSSRTYYIVRKHKLIFMLLITFHNVLLKQQQLVKISYYRKNLRLDAKEKETMKNMNDSSSLYYLQHHPLQIYTPPHPSHFQILFATYTITHMSHTALYILHIWKNTFKKLEAIKSMLFPPRKKIRMITTFRKSTWKLCISVGKTNTVIRR